MDARREHPEKRCKSRTIAREVAIHQLFFTVRRHDAPSPERRVSLRLPIDFLLVNAHRTTRMEVGRDEALGRP
ncbi:MAG: hypothetical protein H6722_12200 [Sandaracinus sp.]|nr:hypothetical protein [Sandaracinus sp.]MCB9613207.1 hypothetical protein [Sandaracinus sp.]